MWGCSNYIYKTLFILLQEIRLHNLLNMCLYKKLYVSFSTMHEWKQAFKKEKEKLKCIEN
jgi:hypothetical protein